MPFGCDAKVCDCICVAAFVDPEPKHSTDWVNKLCELWTTMGCCYYPLFPFLAPFKSSECGVTAWVTGLEFRSVSELSNGDVFLISRLGRSFIINCMSLRSCWALLWLLWLICFWFCCLYCFVIFFGFVDPASMDSNWSRMLLLPCLWISITVGSLKESLTPGCSNSPSGDSILCFLDNGVR